MSSTMPANFDPTNLEDLPPYHVVQFVSRGKQPKNKRLDAVATKWFRFDDQKKKLFVKYPADKTPFTAELSAQYIEHLKLLNNAPNEWIEWHVKVRGTAGNLKDALAKCDEMLKKDKESVLTLESDESYSAAEQRATEKIRKNQFKKIASAIEEKYNQAASIRKKSGTQSQDGPASAAKKIKVAKSLDKNSELPMESMECVPTTSENTEQYEIVEETEACMAQIYQQSAGSSANNFEKCPSGSHPIKVSPPSDMRNTMSHSKPSHGRRESTRGSTSNSVLVEMMASLTNEMRELALTVKTAIKSIQNIESLLSRSGANTVDFIGTVPQISQKFGLNLPFKSVEDFFGFDNNFMGNAQLSSAVSNTLQTGFDPNLVISKCLVRMLKMFLGKEVAKQFVAVLEVPNKFVMYRTNFYKRIEGLIVERRAVGGLNTTEKDMKAALSAVMSNAASWYKTNKKSAHDSPSISHSHSLSNSAITPVQVEVIDVGPHGFQRTVSNGHNVTASNCQGNGQVQLNTSDGIGEVVEIDNDRQLIQQGAGTASLTEADISGFDIIDDSYSPSPTSFLRNEIAGDESSDPEYEGAENSDDSEDECDAGLLNSENYL